MVWKVVCNPFQSSLTILVPLCIISLMCFYLCKVIFSGFINLTVTFSLVKITQNTVTVFLFNYQFSNCMMTFRKTSIVNGLSNGKSVQWVKPISAEFLTTWCAAEKGAAFKLFISNTSNGHECFHRRSSEFLFFTDFIDGATGFSNTLLLTRS